MTFLLGKRIKLVKFTDRFVTARYIDWLNDQDVNKYMFTGRIPVAQKDIDRQDQQNNIMFAIISRLAINDTGQMQEIDDFRNYIGTCSIYKIDNINRNAEIGYMIGDKSYYGIGIGTELIGILVKYGFERLNLHKITAGVVSENVGSIRVLEKNNFKQYGDNPEDYYLDGKYISTLLFYILSNEYFKTI